ncbi:MAG: Rpn family recombination-promoting nuclease/putative transposase [Dolichospermum sp. DL01]|nr:MAG: Rpn family recombination-promoting nuclease/putative transposase [Dolichospermum sp. DL01]
MSYDNTCKYLAETYPQDFARWLLAAEVSEVEILKTELNLEPIRADAVIFLKVGNQILHLEFQTTPKSKTPLDFRMLDYYTRLKRQYWCEIQQVVIFLQATTSEMVFNSQYVDTNTIHKYRVIRMWEEEAAPLLANPALLPLATLAKTDSAENLLTQVAGAVNTIESKKARDNISVCTQLLAGLRFNRNLLNQLFQEDIMEESWVYQDILQKGEQKGKRREALELILRMLKRRFGNIPAKIEQQLPNLGLTQLEDLAEELLDFSQIDDLVKYMANIS